MNLDKNSKQIRMLKLYSAFLNGEIIRKEEQAHLYGVTEKSIQRDIEELRNFFEDQMISGKEYRSIVYSQKLGGYHLIQSESKFLTNSEILAVCKILLESRAFVRRELDPILDKLLSCCVPKENVKLVSTRIGNERIHYMEPHHGRTFIEPLWTLETAIQEQTLIDIQYKKLQGTEPVLRRLQPVGILFSEFYFYLTAFILDIDKKEHFENPDDLFPTIYRVDRIEKITVCDEHFEVPYRTRFEEGEFRKRVQFMYGGKLQTVKFIYSGPSIESVLDRLPTAQILGVENGQYTISAEVFGKGIDMWLRSQGEYVRRLAP